MSNPLNVVILLFCFSVMFNSSTLVFYQCLTYPFFSYCVVGDPEYKPYVIAEPDVATIPLDGREDFIILACDGLWDFLSREDAIQTIYQELRANPGKLY